MSKSVSGSRLYGFEDYKVIWLSQSLLFATWTQYFPWNYDTAACVYLPVNNLPVEVYEGYSTGVEFEPELCHENKDILETAKKVYVHPSCELSRSMMAEVYGKCLNPYVADAVVIPEPNLNEMRLFDVAIFANDVAKMIVIVNIEDDEYIEDAKQFKEGAKFSQLRRNFSNERDGSVYSFEDLLNSEFFYTGKLLHIPNVHSYVLDILTRQLPVNKIVYEKTIQESLATEDNKVTLDVLINIHDMLNSPDDNTVGAGLKALSMLDYMHYSNSIKYIIKSLNKTDYRHNKAANSTSVRFMFKQLSNEVKKNRWPGYYSRKVYAQDYELFKQLLCHYEGYNNDTINERMMTLDFITINGDGLFVPRLIGS